MFWGDVVAENGSSESTEFAAGSGETVGCCTDGSRVHFCSDEEGDSIGAKLVKERGQEVHSLEFFYVRVGSIIGVVESGDNEEDKVHQETNDLHLLAAIEFIIDQER